jgi:hypothetical protein
MEALVRPLPEKADREQALRHVVLHFLHKLHLSRMISVLEREQQMYGEVDPQVARTMKRLWKCTPYGVEVVRVGRPGKPPPGCNLPRLCPWCHARKVAQLYDILSKGPLQQPRNEYLFLGKGRPFAERMGGVDGSYRQEDWYDYTGGKVRGHWGRYFGRDRERLAHTRKVLVEGLMDQAGVGLRNGMWAHQLGSAQLESGHRTFLHDLAMIAEGDEDTLARMTEGQDGWEFSRGRAFSGPTMEATLEVIWLPLPLENPAALRVALAGSSVRYAVSKLDLPQEWVGTGEGRSSGIRGALSWQPTILFDDQMWFAYAEAVKNQPLYQPFGTWKHSMAVIAADARSSIDRKFKDAQARRFARDRQQKGNRRRSREVRDRRAELLRVALEVWPEVLAEPRSGRGRPGHRKHLAELLGDRGIVPSQRDLGWLMCIASVGTGICLRGS